MLSALMGWSTALALQVPYAPPDGGGGVDPAAFRDELTPAMRARIDASILDNVRALEARGARAAAKVGQAAPVKFAWPLAAAPGFAAPDYHGVSNFVDLDARTPNRLRDYACGTRSYDLPGGYNHAGVDLFLWPFPWLSMDAGEIRIVAAAAGTIVGRIDGFDDRSCANHYSPEWNAVYVQHADGTVAWYGHMRKYSQTSKPVGATVEQGEVLGLVGSSGYSSGPHLHFELHSSAEPGYAIIEGHQGACQARASRYLDQRPYHQSRINRLATHGAPPDMGVDCPDPGVEAANLQVDFQRGDPVVFAGYLHDQLAGQVTSYRVLRPDGTVYSQWTHAFEAPAHFAASYWYWTRVLPDDAPAGTWTFEATLLEQSASVVFTVAASVFRDGFE